MDVTQKLVEPTTGEPVLSVVIGIRNWGLDRLEVALRSHREAEIDPIEVVISDYGSENHQDVRKIAEVFGCKYVYTDAPVWSRSAALNAGVMVASAENVLTTDADIIFSPKAHGVLLAHLRQMPNSVQIIQCRDLPDAFGAENLSTFDWDGLFKVSSIRPRWGMGGSATFTKSLFARLHGFEERMTVWGGEDNDFVQRARRSGAPLNWIEDRDAQIYHIWHPPDSRGTSPAGTKVVEQNKKILQEDRTIVRNLSRSYRGSGTFVPTVSIVITTKNRPDLLRESIASCLAQTFEDFEILVVDDGSSEELRASLDDFDDSRIRLFRVSESRGVGFARNYANRLARGEFIAIHDDDDLMLPERLAQQLGAIIDDFAGSYGGWLDFNDETGALTANPGRTTFDRGSMMFGRTLAHATILIRRQVLAFYKYNENFQANSDYHLLNRIARAGVRLAHCGHFVILRRLHTHNLTTIQGSAQKSTASISKAMARETLSVNLDQQLRRAARGIPLAQVPLAELVQAAQFLPSRLLAKRVRLEFHAPISARHTSFANLASAISAQDEIDIEFSVDGPRGITAVSRAFGDNRRREDIVADFASVARIAHASDVVLPAAYATPSMLETDLQGIAQDEPRTLNVRGDVGDMLRVLERHCGSCLLSATGESHYDLRLPPLHPALSALVRAKLRRFHTNARSELEVGVAD